MQEATPFDFDSLFVFEIANNHQGLVAHGRRIIREISAVSREAGVRGAIKLQLRDLDAFIHPAYRESKENKHIQRFLSTRLSETQFAELLAEVRQHGMTPICTPFDEPSVDLAMRLGVDVIKIGSCSALDWPLLERVADAGRPVICSTGGLKIEEIDRIVSFFQHRGIQFALMHCVAIYPTSNGGLHLGQIEALRNRYPRVPIGFSTHEEPGNLTAIGLAYAKGARLFEKHVGIATDGIQLNAYSATPAQVAAWLAAYRRAVEACGGEGERAISAEEVRDLRALMRGVYAKRALKTGAATRREDVFFAMPLLEGQLASGSWREGLVVDRDYAAGEALERRLRPERPTKKDIIYSTIHQVRGMLNTARIPLGHDFSVELSHHYGLERFYEIGCTLIECINRDYAKKLVIQLPGQWNPVHYHMKKDETFQILQGALEVELEGKRRVLEPGDAVWIPCGVWHGFGTQTGVIFEEISTRSYNDDSFYVDRVIARMPREERKTRLHNWGRHQFDDLSAEEGGENE